MRETKEPCDIENEAVDFGRSASHRRAMLRNLASSLFLTERDAEFDPNPPKVKGRIVTTLHKAKEVRPLVEKCVTLARKSLKHTRAAEELETSAERGTDEYRQWRNSQDWRDWANARAPVVAARRRAIQLLGDKQAVQVLFEEIAPRFENRDGGYTRILRLAQPRLGDAGTQAILEFVGENDRVTTKSEKPAFEDADDELDDRIEDVDGTADEEETSDDEGTDSESTADEDAENAEKKEE